jgi:arylsulfatase A-like enzyme
VRAALYEGSYKYILSSDGKNELFDLAADPGEEHDLTAQLPEVAARMRAALESFRTRVRTDAPKGAKRVTGERRNDMKELGYY